ncbi:MAG: TonB-dependent receptor [Duncaniella sp.]|nr:TonB-dependent receptor [Duncaniella sp.]
MKKLLLLFAAVITFALSAAAQNRTVTGEVTSSDGEPLIGATVLGVGTQIGVTTDFDGNFSLSLPTSVKKIEVSYVGMKSKTVDITPGKMLITLENANVLDEVITIAYGTAKRSSFTGSASVLDASQIEAVQVSNPVDALQGKVSGVQLNNASGAPGSAPTIRIRGISSIMAGNSPLIVLDGTPYAGDLNNISSQDIESMTVLKDAASNALYGARGANGVILITTKKGKGNNATVTLDAKWGANSRGTRDYDVVSNPGKYYSLYGRAIGNAQQDAMARLGAANDNLISELIYNVYTVPEGESLLVGDYEINPNASLGALNVYKGQEFWLQPDDWTDEAYRTSLRQEYNLSVSQATDKGSFYVSGSYLNNEGIVQNSGFERFTGRMTGDLMAKPWLKIGANMSYTHFSSKALGDDGEDASSGNIFAVANQIAPIYPLYVRDGQGNIMVDRYGNQMMDYGDPSLAGNMGLKRPVYAGANPIMSSRLDTNNAEGNAFSASGYAEIRFLKDFKFTTNNSVDVDETRINDVTNPWYGMYASSNGMVTVQHSRSINYTFQQLLNWAHSFGDHNVSALLGHENYWDKTYMLYANSTNMIDPKNHELAGAIIAGNNSSYTTDYDTEGWFGRANYDYDGKYFVSASYRRDGSSRFHPDHRWGNFWSAGGAWIISKENFFQAPWVDMLKIKASYGEQGNDNIGNYRYTNTYTIFNANGYPATLPSTMGNKDITWEKGGNFNAGVDFAFWNERLSGTVEAFVRKTSDMLFSFPLPPSYGFTSYYANVGDMKNTGFEIDLHGDIIRTKNFTWSANANFTFYKNKITYLPEPRKTQVVDGVRGFSSGNMFYGEGSSIYTFRLKKYAGVFYDPDLTGEEAFKQNGQPMWWVKRFKDADGNVVAENSDKIASVEEYTTTNYSEGSFYLCGTALPWGYGGFGTSFNFFGVDASIDFMYQLGGQVYDSDYASLMASPMTGQGGRAMHKDLYNSWSEENLTSDIPRFRLGDQFTAASSDRFLTSASYLAIRNVNVGYTLPAKFTKKFQVDKIRFYFSGDNLCVWSKRKGLDPRQSISGASTNAYYATIRTLTGRVKINY